MHRLANFIIQWANSKYSTMAVFLIVTQNTMSNNCSFSNSKFCQLWFVIYFSFDWGGKLCRSSIFTYDRLASWKARTIHLLHLHFPPSFFHSDELYSYSRNLRYRNNFLGIIIHLGMFVPPNPFRRHWLIKLAGLFIRSLYRLSNGFDLSKLVSNSLHSNWVIILCH